MVSSMLSSVCSTALPSCPPCYIEAETNYLTYPYDIVTQTLSVIPHVTGLANGTNITSYSTITQSKSFGAPHWYATTINPSQEAVWTVGGVELTSGTIYAQFGNATGAAAATSASCSYDPSSIQLPTNTDPASFIWPLPSAYSVPIRTQASFFNYLGSFPTVVAQLGGNDIVSCSWDETTDPFQPTCEEEVASIPLIRRQNSASESVSGVTKNTARSLTYHTGSVQYTSLSSPGILPSISTQTKQPSPNTGSPTPSPEPTTALTDRTSQPLETNPERSSTAAPPASSSERDQPPPDATTTPPSESRSDGNGGSLAPVESNVSSTHRRELSTPESDGPVSTAIPAESHSGGVPVTVSPSPTVSHSGGEAFTYTPLPVVISSDGSVETHTLPPSISYSGSSEITYTPAPFVSISGGDGPSSVISRSGGVFVTYTPSPIVSTDSDGAQITQTPPPTFSTSGGVEVTYFPTPVISLSGGVVITYTRSPVVETSDGSLVTHTLVPTVSTSGGVEVTYYPSPIISLSEGIVVTYTPSPVVETSNGVLVTHSFAPTISTSGGVEVIIQPSANIFISGGVVITYTPSPIVSTSNGVLVTRTFAPTVSTSGGIEVTVQPSSTSTRDADLGSAIMSGLNPEEGSSTTVTYARPSGTQVTVIPVSAAASKSRDCVLDLVSLLCFAPLFGIIMR